MTVVVAWMLALAACSSGPGRPTHVPDRALPAFSCSDARPCSAAAASDPRLSYCYGPGDTMPCGQPGCAEVQHMCSSDATCGTGYACEATGGWPSGQQCVPKACQRPADCGGHDFACEAGRCIGSPCRSPDDCDGYCVGGRCAEYPGRCFYPPGTPMP